jgi:FKBP-type peptidyl-prolyl cis-trans isomerase
MRKSLFPVLMALLVTPGLLAQAGKWKEKRMNNVHPGTFDRTTHPTKVTGEGHLTASGVTFWDIQIGEGQPATKGHAVKVLYRAWIKNGKEFASSISDGRPPVFTLGAGQVIRGWEEGVEGMRVGGKRQLKIPPQLAYGAAGVPSLVPPNSTLIYDVVLLGLQ